MSQGFLGLVVAWLAVFASAEESVSSLEEHAIVNFDRPCENFEADLEAKAKTLQDTRMPQAVPQFPLTQPDYPPASKRLGETGAVDVDVLVNGAGDVAVAQLRLSSGFDRLDRSALTEVGRWRLSPGRIEGQPVCAWTQFRINFKLDPDYYTDEDLQNAIVHAEAERLAAASLRLDDKHVDSWLLKQKKPVTAASRALMKAALDAVRRSAAAEKRRKKMSAILSRQYTPKTLKELPLSAVSPGSRMGDAARIQRRSLTPLIVCTANVLDGATKEINARKLLKRKNLAPEFAGSVSALAQRAIPYCECTSQKAGQCPAELTL